MYSLLRNHGEMQGQPGRFAGTQEDTVLLANYRVNSLFLVSAELEFVLIATVTGYRCWPVSPLGDELTLKRLDVEIAE
jgi:hypothetical protein